MKNELIIIVFTLIISSCDSVKEKTKETLNKSGEIVGKTTTEFMEGVTEGVDRTLDREISLSESLKSSGLRTGKVKIDNDSTGGENNLLTIYMIFEKDFNKEVSAKAFDKTGLEIGRTKLLIEGKAGDAKYYDFLFDNRTNIEVKSKIVFE